MNPLTTKAHREANSCIQKILDSVRKVTEK